MIKGSSPRLVRQFTACLALLALVGLGGCETVDEFSKDLLAQEKAQAVVFQGAVVADEPEAALVGREVLMANGNAIDAVVATSLALGVTLPSQVGLMGSGMCLVRSSYYERNAVMDMIAVKPSAPSLGDRPAAVSTLLRGLYALHSRHGTMPWRKMVAPAEKMARFGVSVSRALAKDLQSVGPALLVDDGARLLFGRADGQGVKREGDQMSNPALADLLAGLRTEGLKGFYNTESLKRFETGALAAGGGVTANALLDAKPGWREPLAVRTADFFGTVFFTPPPMTAGVTTAQLWGMLTYDDLDLVRSWDQEDYYTKAAHLLMDSAGRAYSDRTGWEAADGSSRVNPQTLVSNNYIGKLLKGFNENSHTPTTSLTPKPKTDFVHPAGTVVAAVDRQGSAAVCLYTMNNAFGTGRVAGDTGLLLTAMPGPGGRGPQGLTGMMAVSEKDNGIYFVGGAAGGVAAPTALVQTAIRPLANVQTLAQSQKQARLHHGGTPDVVFYERGLQTDVLEALQKRGFKTEAVDTLGRVNAIACAEGLPMNASSCAAVADPRGLGLAASANW